MRLRWLIPSVALLLTTSACAAAGATQSVVRVCQEPSTSVPVPVPVALFIGDSYSVGLGASTPTDRWTTLVAGQLGWTEENKALSSTGYTATRGGPAYPQVLTEPVSQVPDIVVISGGRNDIGVDLTRFRAAVESTLVTAHSRWPQAKVVVTDPLWDSGPLPQALLTLSAIVSEVVGEQNATWLDLHQPLLGNPGLVAGDGVHPNDLGHAAIADSFTTAWRAIKQVDVAGVCK